MQDELHTSHKRHRNALYSLVVLLAIFQIISFVIISTQVSKLTFQLEQEIQEARQFTSQMIETYNSIYQENFNQISDNLILQQKSFDNEIKDLKSAQQDFSGVVEDVVRGVVTVKTDSSLGTGFFVNSNGYIVTNYHVISDSDSIQVVTYDREVYQATLIGMDETRDLALLLIPGDFDSLELAERQDIQVGKKVIAIGNPLGLSFTVTEGIISGIDRVGPNGMSGYVQTDVSLNPGNSGGPLIDTKGKVVGINNFKIGGAEALGFSLASYVIKEEVNLIANSTIIP